MCLSYKRMEEKDVILDRTLFLLTLISNKRMVEKDVILDRTSFLYSYFLQKNGGKGCHRGQDLVFFTRISYKRMEEKDVIVDRTLSIIFLMSQRCDGTDLLSFDWYYIDISQISKIPHGYYLSPPNILIVYMISQNPLPYALLYTSSTKFFSS